LRQRGTAHESHQQNNRENRPKQIFHADRKAEPAVEANFKMSGALLKLARWQTSND